ncbi:MAG: hypothetical protein KDD50_12055 [Bdellovibrionales bacterium]|nr:hypothetical protein [Bdellovibrionales bacterium]
MKYVVLVSLLLIGFYAEASRFCRVNSSASNGSSRYRLDCEGFSGRVSDSQSVLSVVVNVLNVETLEETRLKKQAVPLGKGLSDVIRDVQNIDLKDYPQTQYIYEQFLEIEEGIDFYLDVNMQKKGTIKNNVKFGQNDFVCHYLTTPQWIEKSNVCVGSSRCYIERNGYRLEPFTSTVFCPRNKSNKCPQARECFLDEEVKGVSL